ncbi:MAG: AMP-binding protein [Acidobacteriota bacterium]
MKLSLLAAAREHPRRTALVSAGREMTFAELVDPVRSAMAWLQPQGGAGPSPEPIGMLGETSFETLVWIYAAIELGIPLALVHPRTSASAGRAWLAEIGVARWLDPADVDRNAATGTLAETPPDLDSERALAIVRTSGSSGRPKGVVLSRRAFVAAARASALNLGWRDDDRWLLSLPVAHVGGLSVLTRCLMARRAVVIRPQARFEAATVARIVAEDRVTLLSLVPTMLGRLLDLEGFELPRYLRAILLGGAGSPPDLLARAADRRWPVLTTYGLTEACSQVATQRYGTVNRGGRGCEPVEGVEVRIRDGVVEIRGPSLMSGYVPEPATAPFDAEGWLATGDLGRLDDAGRLHILGRRDDVIVTGGENVHPREVEEALAAHPAIAAACVFGLQDDEWGQVVAAAVAAASPPTDEALTRYLKGCLAPHQRPRRIAYLEALPEITLGKIDRRQAALGAAPRLRPLSYRR